jgi:hypothetical protein
MTELNEYYEDGVKVNQPCEKCGSTEVWEFPVEGRGWVRKCTYCGWYVWLTGD